ncbi:uncharacterized protein N7473_013177 [Penicillium subrubescens]|uniref:uncharacterized protein n=1 Tax=Penicillium subrubescens TaxID=1316194 RepID=UPI00254540D1|nr:uncharacterized protein N7473_013177 [Penicillium subrubescens]KAJ5873618.1 hypothetical protein N7473_013177 [Penicillium subrubescens]
MGSAALSGDLDINPERVGRPRLDPYERLLSRFYEQLFLLNALGQTRGNHTFPPFELDDRRAKARRFLQNLCYICDFKKGGSACTSVGLEELDTCYNFCVATNGETGKIAEFLTTALSSLEDIAHPTGTNQDYKNSRFLHLCIEFAAKRIEGEKKCLRRGVKDCLSRLKGQTLGSEFVEWLDMVVSFDNHFQLCEFAYNTRHSDQVRELYDRAMEEEARRAPSEKRSSFFLVRHYVGRLAHHIRAPKQLIDDTEDLNFLGNHTVYAIGAPSAVPPTIRDSQVNLRGILNRMFRKGDEERPQVEGGLLHLNKVAGVFGKFLHEYEHSSPEVHAEVQVLEHFHKMQKSFAGEDRFIACSKPACLCCEMYFKYHPAHVTVSCSHRKIWPNWSPPHLNHFDSQNPATRQQRDILNKMTGDLRGQVIAHVLQRSPSNPWHPDSITNITNVRYSDNFSVSFEVSNATTTKLFPVVLLSTHPNGFNSPPETAIPHILEGEADFDDVSDEEKGGVSIFDCTPATLDTLGNLF